MNINQPDPIPFVSLLIPSSPVSEASEVTRRKKQAAYSRAYYAVHRVSVIATKRAWHKANPDKQGQYNRTHFEKVKAAAADAVPVQPVLVEVTLSDLVQQLAELRAELRAELNALKGSRRAGFGLLIEKVSTSTTKPSSR